MLKQNNYYNNNNNNNNTLIYIAPACRMTSEALWANPTPQNGYMALHKLQIPVTPCFCAKSVCPKTIEYNRI